MTSRIHNPRIPESFSRDKCWNLSFDFHRSINQSWIPPIEAASIHFYQFLINLLKATSKDIQQVVRRDNSAAHKILDINTWSEEILDFLESRSVSSYFGQETPDLWSFSYCLESRAPQRFYAFIVEGVIHPVMWDPDHKYSGSQYKNKLQVNCSRQLNCFHN
jgi:hypothetical protein